MKKHVFFHRLIAAVLGFLGVWGVNLPVQATHLMGSEITWQCLGNNQYKVILAVFRDCTGVTMGNMSISYHCADSPSVGNAGSASSPPLLSNGLDITPICDDTCSECGTNQYGGNPNCALGYGVELYEYQFTVDVTALKNAGCCRVRFYWTSCCRNDDIDNLQNPTTQGLYNYGEVDICDSQCNNGPAFSCSPLLMLIKNQDIAYSVDVVDADHDSIVFELGTPYRDGPTNNNPTASFQAIPYVTGYSATQPIKFMGWPNANLPLPYGFHFDALTGNLRFRPTHVGGYVVVFVTKKYRNGELVGINRQDIRVWVVEQDNNVPELSGINGTDSFLIQACEGEQLCFNIHTRDADTADSLILTWNAAIPGATFTVTEPPVSQADTTAGPMGQFCWTPPPGSASTVPYRFTVKVRDTSCPIEGRTVLSYLVKVNANVVTSASDTIRICQGDSALIGNTWRTQPGVYIDTSVNTSGCDHIQYTTLMVHSPYSVMVSDSICAGDTAWVGNMPYTQPGTYTDTLSSMYGCDSVVTLNLSVMTVDSTVTVSNGTLTAAQGNAQYQWLDCANNMAPIAGATGQSYTPPATGYYAVKVTYQGCEVVSGCHAVVITGLDALQTSIGLRVYPNPACEAIYFDPSRPGAYELRLSDLVGKEYVRRRVMMKRRYMLDVRDLPRGFYFLEVRRGRSVEVLRLRLE